MEQNIVGLSTASIKFFEEQNNLFLSIAVINTVRAIILARY